MKNSVKEDATENMTELGLDDLEAISGGDVTPEVAAQLDNLSRGVLKLERATSLDEQLRIAQQLTLTTVKIQNLLNPAEKNP